MVCRLFLSLLLFSHLQLPGQYPNVVLGSAYAPNEPSIVMHPKHPNILMVGANTFNYYISTDTGYTWSAHVLTSSHGVWGDPVLVADTAGDFYFFHLSNPPSGSWIDRIVCQKNGEADTSWTDGTYFGLNGTKAQDKQWVTIDRSTNRMYATWTQFDKYGSTLTTDSSSILFTTSADGGDTWSTPMRINKVGGDCIDDDKTVEGAVPAVGVNGELYVAWADSIGIVFDRSLDSGTTWLNEDIRVTTQPGGWNFNIPGIRRCNGLPVLVSDTASNSAFRGTLYINFSDQRNGAHDTDVWLVKSTDGGDTWSAPMRVNNDSAGKQQFFTWMAIDQTNGYLYCVFYDRRNYSDDATDVYLAVSKDGGESFTNFKISEEPFVPVNSIFFGDYNNIAAHNGIIRPVWTRLHNGQLSILTAIINANDSVDIFAPQLQSPVFELNQNYPNPASAVTYVSFKLHSRAKVSLKVYDTLGKLVATTIDNAWYDYGKHIAAINTKTLGESGVYYYELKVDDRVKTRNMLVLQK